MTTESGPRMSILRLFCRFVGESRTWMDGRPLLPLLSDLRHYPNYAGMLRPNTPTGARGYHRMMRWVFAREYAERARLGRRLTASDGGDRIDPRKGFLLRNLSDRPAVQDVLARCDEIRAGLDFERELRKHGKPTLRTYRLRQDDPNNDSIFRLATDPILLGPIADYLGGIPVLQVAAISYSPNQALGGRSQTFHLDRDDYRQVKVNVYLEDIDEEAGPLTIFPADESRRTFDRLRHQGIARNRTTYLRDKSVLAASDTEKVIPLCGPRGSIALVDTCNCFHYGSRPGKKPRWTLYLHYVSAYAVSLPVWGRRVGEYALAHGDDPEADRVRALVLGLSHLALPRVMSRRHADAGYIPT